VTAVTAPKAPKPPKELTPEEQARADALDIRCLSLCIGMLERVNSVQHRFFFPRNDHLI
jgi:condensin complex subunit 3